MSEGRGKRKGTDNDSLSLLRDAFVSDVDSFSLRHKHVCDSLDAIGVETSLPYSTCAPGHLQDLHHVYMLRYI